MFKHSLLALVSIIAGASVNAHEFYLTAPLLSKASLNPEPSAMELTGRLLEAEFGQRLNIELTSDLQLIGSPKLSMAAVSWRAEGLPSGVSLTSDGRIVGSPETSGEQQFDIIATYGAVSSSARYTLAASVGIATINGARRWADGGTAASCEDYIRAGNTLRKYSGDTGTGVYAIGYNGATFEAYCDMTTDGGGWQRLGYFNQPQTSYSTAVSNLNPSSNWQAPPANHPRMSSGNFLVNLPTREKWIRYANFSMANSNVGATSGSIQVDPPLDAQGKKLWLSSGWPAAVLNFNPCGSNALLEVVMATQTARGTHPGLQVWQTYCDSINYQKTDIPFEVYVR